MKKSERMQREGEFIREKFGTGSICQRCGATLDTFADACTADLTDPCPGFLAIDRAKAEFGR
jgi:hypothetical protein